MKTLDRNATRPTYRQRRMARVHVLDERAESHHQLARKALRTAEDEAGRLSERSLDIKLEKIATHAGAAVELKKKAHTLRSITNRAIYDDDPDVLQLLEARVELMLSRREGIRQYNLSCGRGMPQRSYLSEDDQRRLERLKQSGELGPDQSLPPHVLRYLSWDIAKVRRRIAGIRHKVASAGR